MNLNLDCEEQDMLPFLHNKERVTSKNCRCASPASLKQTAHTKISNY